MTPMHMVMAVVLVIMIDTALGLLNALKVHKLSSSVGRLGLSQKMAEIILMFGIVALSSLDRVHFPSELLTALYAYLLFFEITSVVENLSKLGLNLSMITKYFK